MLVTAADMAQAAIERGGSKTETWKDCKVFYLIWTAP